jgi:hypothetical protein
MDSSGVWRTVVNTTVKSESISSSSQLELAAERGFCSMEILKSRNLCKEFTVFRAIVLGTSPKDIKQSIVAIEKVPLEAIARNIVTCMGVTYKTGFGMDDWIY